MSLNELNGFKETNKNKKDVSMNINKKSMILVGAIIAVILIFVLLIKSISGGFSSAPKADVASIIKNKETQIIYVGSNSSSKCDKCKEVVNYLDKENISYVSYIVDNYSDKEYKEMLKSLGINPDDFGYPGVLYIKDGKLYSNVININDVKSLEVYINNYELKKVSKEIEKNKNNK